MEPAIKGGFRGRKSRAQLLRGRATATRCEGARVSKDGADGNGRRDGRRGRREGRRRDGVIGR